MLGVRDFRVKTLLTVSPASSFYRLELGNPERGSVCSTSHHPRDAPCAYSLLVVLFCKDCARWSCLAIGAQLSVPPAAPVGK